MKKTILVLAADPKNTPPLRLAHEVREIGNGLERSKHREEFVLEQKLAARPVDVRRAMLDFRPNIVHFCGHGSGEEGIAFEDEEGQEKLVSTDALADFFKLFAEQLECVVLNACYSEVQAEAIGKHIPYVIGMKKAIGDDAATKFAVAFYDALGAGGSIEFAYELACNAIQWEGTPEHLTPVLKSTIRSTAGKSTISQVPAPPQMTKRISPKERDKIRAERNKALTERLEGVDGILRCSVFQVGDHTDKGYLLHVKFDVGITRAADVLSIIRRTIEELFPDIPYWGHLLTESDDAVGFGYAYIDEYNKLFK